MCLRMTSPRRSSPVCTRFVDGLQGFYTSYKGEMLLCAKNFYRTIVPLPPIISVKLYCCRQRPRSKSSVHVFGVASAHREHNPPKRIKVPLPTLHQKPATSQYPYQEPP
jgi:hypothetical protein